MHKAELKTTQVQDIRQAAMEEQTVNIVSYSKYFCIETMVTEGGSFMQAFTLVVDDPFVLPPRYYASTK